MVPGSQSPQMSPHSARLRWHSSSSDITVTGIRRAAAWNFYGLLNCSACLLRATCTLVAEASRLHTDSALTLIFHFRYVFSPSAMEPDPVLLASISPSRDRKCICGSGEPMTTHLVDTSVSDFYRQTRRCDCTEAQSRRRQEEKEEKPRLQQVSCCDPPRPLHCVLLTDKQNAEVKHSTMQTRLGAGDP